MADEFNLVPTNNTEKFLDIGAKVPMKSDTLTVFPGKSVGRRSL